MIVKFINLDDYVQYKKSSMVVGCYKCDFKCCKDSGMPISVCQNQQIYNQKNIDVSEKELFEIYNENTLVKSVVFSGFEPMLQFEDVISVLKYFRENGCEDDFVIYTGYYPKEISTQLDEFKKYKNVYFKFGRYIPNNEKHFDNVLGVYLASDNQYGEKIS